MYYPTQPTFNSFQPALSIVRVNGKGGAEAYQMPPNSEALLLDESAPVVWLVVTDGAGYKTATSYDITPSVTQEQKDADRLSAIENRILKLEELINDKSDPGRVESE